MIEPFTHTALLDGTLRNLYFPPEKDQYAYFKRAAQSPFVQGDTITKAAWAADASMLSYARYNATDRMSDDDLKANFDRAGLNAYRKIGVTPWQWTAPGPKAVFACCADFAILAFRGTEADDSGDAFYDADILLVPEHDYRPSAADPHPALQHLTSITQPFSRPCLVHRGFQMALGQLWDQVHQAVCDYRQQYPDKEIQFAGHSLGGALALLAFSRFSDEHISLYTFGCPRVGDGPFRDRVLSNPGMGQFRFVNLNDVVTHVPLESLLYRHVPAQCYRIDQQGNIDEASDSFHVDIQALDKAVHGLPASLRAGLLREDASNIPAPSSVVDHSPARYCMRLWDCVEP